MRGRWVSAAVALVIGALGAVNAYGTEAPPGVTVTAAPKWGNAQTGSWAPYLVTVTNKSDAEVQGDIVLSAQPEPPLLPGAPPTPPTTAPPPTVTRIGGQAVTAAIPVGAGATTETPEWPDYRASIVVGADTEKSLTIMVLQAPFGFDVKLRDISGRVLASTSSAPPVRQVRVNVLVLSELPDVDSRVESLSSMSGRGVDVTQLRNAKDFPDQSLHLAGLDIIVLADFDTAGLVESQRQALSDYVSLGGSLVLTGGLNWARTLASLPADLVPLRPSALSPVSMAPLADLIGATTAAAADVATGELAHGQMVVGAPDGPPLVIESEYRSGRVVQLTFDPLLDPISSDAVLYGLAWDQMVARNSSRWGAYFNEPTPEDQLWLSSLGDRPWPSWPRSNVVLLVIFSVALAPAAYLVARRARPLAGLTVLVVAVVAATVAGMGAGRPRTATTQTIVEVQTPAAPGRVLTATYRGVYDLDLHDPVPVASGAASTVFSDRPLFGTFRGVGFDQTSRFFVSLPGYPKAPVRRGLGGGTVDAAANSAEVHLGAGAWELRTVGTVTIGRGGPDLDAKLALVGDSRTDPGRLQGTVTNRGAAAISQVRAQTPGGQVLVADVLAPGETKRVDLPMTPIKLDTSGTKGPGSGLDEEVVMFAAAQRSFSGPDQVAVVGLTGPAPGSPAKKTDRRISVVVMAVPLESTQTVGGSGGAHVLSASPPGSPESFSVAELRSASGVGPLSINYSISPVTPGNPPPPRASYELYNWTTGTWRSLPTVGEKANYAFAVASVEAQEVNNGLVRFRARVAQTDSVPGLGAQLVVIPPEER